MLEETVDAAAAVQSYNSAACRVKGVRWPMGIVEGGKAVGI